MAKEITENHNAEDWFTLSWKPFKDIEGGRGNKIKQKKYQ